MGRNIIFSANNNEEVIVLPVVPEVELEQGQDNEEFKTINNGTIKLIGDEGLRTFSITSIFPCREYGWLKYGSVADPFLYVDFFNRWRGAKVPMRVIASKDNDTEWFNMPCLVDNFSHKPRRNGDVAYTLDVSEYSFVRAGV